MENRQLKDKILKTAKPILFNTEMVKAIKDGRKVQTRRIITKINIVQKDIKSESLNGAVYKDDNGGLYFQHNIIEDHSKYKKGDVLYVRETFGFTLCGQLQFRSDNETFIAGGWKPSIHMPKEHARLFLKVIDVTVKKIQDITFEDIFKEGFNGKIKDYFVSTRYKDKAITATTPKELEVLNWWITLWNSTAKDGYKLEDNPFVFVYEFEVLG